jgi:hypothetical protein
MLCCGQCFRDRGLSKEIVPWLSSEIGDCPTCGAKSQDLVDAKKLGDYFDVLCGIYTSDDSGKVLIDWLIDDWHLFKLDRATANNLLVEILDDGERVRQHVVPSELCRSNRLDRWEQLRDELRHQNRFFPVTDFEHERLRDLLSSVKLDEDDRPVLWYRARIAKGREAFGAEQMGAPPKEAATHGRANPAGIPYLYLGSTSETAVAEVRPHPGEIVCVAEFSIETGLQIVDLRNPRELVSPFLLGDESAIALMRGDIEFLERLGQELTTPVLPNAAAIDYIPSQYLCEFIKKCGYLGVVYSSSVNAGVNLALFDPGRAKVGKVTEYSVDRVSVDVSEVSVRKSK